MGTSTIGTIPAAGLGGVTNNVPLFGYEMLCLAPYLLNSALGIRNVPVPSGTTGYGIATQGVRIETDAAGIVVIVLMNAQDPVIG